MSESISTAIQILGVGMVTVALVLSLVVLMGKVMIAIINRLPSAPSEIRSNNSTTDFSAIDKSKMAAIVAAVSSVSNGTATITKIEKD